MPGLRRLIADLLHIRHTSEDRTSVGQNYPRRNAETFMLSFQRKDTGFQESNYNDGNRGGTTCLAIFFIYWTAAAALQRKREQEEQKAGEVAIAAAERKRKAQANKATKEVAAAERKRKAQANKAKTEGKKAATAQRKKDQPGGTAPPGFDAAVARPLPEGEQAAFITVVMMHQHSVAPTARGFTRQVLRCATLPRAPPCHVVAQYRSTGNVWQATPKQCPGI